MKLKKNPRALLIRNIECEDMNEKNVYKRKVNMQ
jgi:hypothetical protein